MTRKRVVRTTISLAGRDRSPLWFLPNTIVYHAASVPHTLIHSLAGSITQSCYARSFHHSDGMEHRMMPTVLWQLCVLCDLSCS